MPPITFAEVPSGAREPFTYVEFDPSQANQGPSVQTYRALLIGYRLSAGTVAALTPKRVTSAAQVAEFAGEGSQAHQMAVAWFAQNNSTETWVCLLDEPSGGTAATGTFTITGTATKAGSVYAYVGGHRAVASVAVGDTATAVGAALATALGNLVGDPCTYGAAGGVVTCTARHKGVYSHQELTLGVNFYQGEETPEGLSVAVVQIGDAVAGAGSEDIDLVWPVLGETQFNVIVSGLTDASNTAKLDAELADRWAADRAIEGVAIMAKDDSHAGLVTYGDALNSKHLTVVGMDSAQSPPWEIASAVGAWVARRGASDPAQPFTGLRLLGIIPPVDTLQFTLAERDLLLHDGISTLTVDSSGAVYISRLITTYQENTQGLPDTAFLNLNTPLTLGYLRFDWRSFWASRYSGYKLADDDAQFAPGQKVMTPKRGRAEAIAKFREWEALGLVEDFDQFKADLIVERSATDKDRLDFLLPPNLVNQLYVTGVQIAFRS